MIARLSRVVCMIRQGQMEQAVHFYHNTLGLGLRRITDDWAELDLGNAITLHLRTAETEAHVSTGYSPILTLEVDDMASLISECIQQGAHLDGPIQYPAHGKVASLRTPDGHVIGLYEPNV